MRGLPERRSKVVAAAAVMVAAVLLAGAVSAVDFGSGDRSRPGRAAVAAAEALPVAPPVIAAPAPAPPPPSFIATLSAPTSYSAAPGGAPVGTLDATNPFGAPQALAVIGTPDGSGWLHVEVPVRPNGSTGWIRASGVAISRTGYRVLVDRAARTLTVTDAGQTVLSTPAAVGSPSSPTPAGTTYLWELIRPDNPAGAYGPYIFGLAEFSDTYALFNGGDAQIGIHGQDEPWSIGRAVSHGCVRLPNDVITRLAGMLPLGTPVTIS